MELIRRIYILLVCMVTLLALTAGTTALLWDINPLGPRAPVTTIALEIATLVVALPLFLVHWLWAQQLARAEQERGDILRRGYLYAMLGIFVFGSIVQVVDLLTTLANVALNPSGPSNARFIPVGKLLTDPAIAIVVLALLGLYHYRRIRDDARVVPEIGNAAAVHRLYILTFSAIGLVLTAFSFAQLLRWVLFQIGASLLVGDVTPSDELVRLVVGAVVWVVFWRAAQFRFNGPGDEERESALRKFYLYLAVAAGAIGSVLGLSFIFAEIMRRMFGLLASGDLRNPLSVAFTSAVVWAYHYIVLRADTQRAPTLPRQAGIRRLYLYLVAAIGLASVLGGLIAAGNGVLRVLFGEPMSPDTKELFAWAFAAIIAGLPVWLVPWLSVEQGALAAGTFGAEGRRSLARKIYLYFYLFLATMTVLVSAVFILSQILGIVMGGGIPNDLLSNLSQAIGFVLIAVCVWIYHGWALRTDGTIAYKERMERLSRMHIAVVDGQEGSQGCAIVNALKRELPTLQVDAVDSVGMEAKGEESAALGPLRSAAVILAPWTTAGAQSAIAPAITQAMAASSARKLLIPFAAKGWEWVGVEHGGDEALVQLAVRAVKQILEGEEIKPTRSPILLAILVIIGTCIVLELLSTLVPLLARMR